MLGIMFWSNIPLQTFLEGTYSFHPFQPAFKSGFGVVVVTLTNNILQERETRKVQLLDVSSVGTTDHSVFLAHLHAGILLNFH